MERDVLNKTVKNITTINWYLFLINQQYAYETIT
jgi:hypothetical protein